MIKGTFNKQNESWVRFCEPEKRILVIMPTKDDQEMTNIALECILNAGWYMGSKAEIDLAIVSNTSKDWEFDPTYIADLMQTTDGLYGVFVNKKPMGYAESINQVLASVNDAIYDGYLIINNDAFVDEMFFQYLLNAEMMFGDRLIYGPMTNKCAGKQCTTDVVDEKEENQFKVYKFAKYSAADISWYITSPALQKLEKKFPNEYDNVRWVNGFCMYISSEAMKIVGRFDEYSYPLSGEEIDWCIRAHRMGLNSIIDFHNFVYHLKGETTKTLSPGERETLWRNATNLLRERYGSVSQ